MTTHGDLTAVLKKTLDTDILPGDTYRLDDITAHALGVHGTTPLFVRRATFKERLVGKTHGDKIGHEFTVRMGFAIMGHTNMTDEMLEACDNNPFHEEFYDNYTQGSGNTVEDAYLAMLLNIQQISLSLFA